MKSYPTFIENKLTLNEMNLHIELSKFGLEPREWSLKKQSQFEYIIQNKSDPHFSFRGLTYWGGGLKKWKSVILSEI